MTDYSAPRSPADPLQPSSADEMASLKLYVDLANSEKQAIWARHATMLVGNSLIVNAVRSDIAKLEPMTTVFLNGAGLSLCIIWAVMTWTGWTWFYKCMAEGKKLNVPHNPFKNIEDLPTIATRARDIIFICTMAVVVIFAAVYLVGLLPLIRSLATLVCR
jgi:hypothetical protein